VASICATIVNAMTRDRQGTMQVVQLFAIKPYGLLPAPPKPVNPSRIAQDDAFDAARRLDYDFDSFVFTGGLNNFYRCVMIALHRVLLEELSEVLDFIACSVWPKLKSNFNSDYASPSFHVSSSFFVGGPLGSGFKICEPFFERAERALHLGQFSEGGHRTQRFLVVKSRDAAR
jgi:hypothetical protein